LTENDFTNVPKLVGTAEGWLEGIHDGCDEGFELGCNDG
jgi:hypothetical protein